VPYIFRAVFLGITFIVAFIFYERFGFTQKKEGAALKQMKNFLLHQLIRDSKNQQSDG